VAPPWDEFSKLVFHLQNQARPIHSNAHFFKIPALICIIFDWSTVTINIRSTTTNAPWIWRRNDQLPRNVIVVLFTVSVVHHLSVHGLRRLYGHVFGLHRRLGRLYAVPTSSTTTTMTEPPYASINRYSCSEMKDSTMLLLINLVHCTFN